MNDIANYLITGDNCTALVDFNLGIINQDILLIKVILGLATLLLFVAFVNYVKIFSSVERKLS